jgi:hypothetical protein
MKRMKRHRSAMNNNHKLDDKLTQVEVGFLVHFGALPFFPTRMIDKAEGKLLYYQHLATKRS